MKNLKLLVLCAVGITSAAIVYAQQEPARGTTAPAKPQDPALIDVADVQGLPRVLLIGDSISMGYTLPVRERLQGIANVHHPAENCGPTERGLARLELWLGSGHWDVIHFNFGLHDLKYLDAKGNYVRPDQGRQVAPPPVYERNLRALVALLKKTGARLIFATTTQVPADSLGRVEGDERLYNKVAVKVMRENDIPIDDLWAIVLPQQKEIQRPKNVHFTTEGWNRLADQVSASVKESLFNSR